jgi:hypothetical protein
MTSILFERFKKRFPPINEYERIRVYENFERIYLDLIKEEFLSAHYINPKEEIEELAKKIFDVNFACRSLSDGGDSRLAIIFDPIILPKGKMNEEDFMYHSWYDGHSIEISLPARHPMVTISTGNRGRTDLLNRQRDLYYNFTEEVYNLFLKKAR